MLFFQKDFLVPTLPTRDGEDSSDDGDEADRPHVADTITTEPLQVVPDVVPE